MGKFKHGKIHTRLYHIYNNMKERCYNENSIDYLRYGARGIKICDEWLNDFMLFHNWSMDNGYHEDLTLDRIDVNGNYGPDNCRWVDRKAQARNRRSNKNYTINGETHCLKDWCNIVNINYHTVRTRLRYNWTIEKALFTPVKK